MTPETRRVLDVIDEALRRHDTSSQEIWDILAAVRGPDASTFAAIPIKEATTCVMRGLAFPKTLATGVGEGNLVHVAGNGYYSKAKEIKTLTPEELEIVGPDFESHIRYAAEALKEESRG